MTVKSYHRNTSPSIRPMREQELIPALELADDWHGLRLGLKPQIEAREWAGQRSAS